MIHIGKAGGGIAVAMILAATTLLASSPVLAISTKQAMQVCRERYGKGITSVVIKKNGHIVCQEGPGRLATRQQVFDYCKKKFGATMVVVRKRPGGKWFCGHNGN